MPVSNGCACASLCPRGLPSLSPAARCSCWSSPLSIEMQWRHPRGHCSQNMAVSAHDACNFRAATAIFGLQDPLRWRHCISILAGSCAELSLPTFRSASQAGMYIHWVLSAAPEQMLSNWPLKPKGNMHQLCLERTCISSLAH